MGKLLFYLTIFGSLMSQLPYVIEYDLGYIFKNIWIITFFYMIIQDYHSLVDKSIILMSSGAVTFGVFCTLLNGISPNKYYTDDLMNIFISLLVFISSYLFFKKYNSKNTIYTISIILLIGSLILSYVVYSDFFTDFDLNDRLYAYQGKNSLGQILLSGILIVGLLWNPKFLGFTLLKYSSILWIALFTIILKSRATLVGVIFIFIYLIFNIQSKQKKYALLLLTLGLFIYVITMPELYSTIIYSFIFNNRDLNDLNDLSSNRLLTVQEAVQLIPNNFFFGIGDKYLDCMPIAMLLQYGIIGASIIFVYLYMVWLKIKGQDRNNKIHLCSYLLFISMMLNSFFEARPPFGPGIKCFMIWMIFGFSMALQQLKDEKVISGCIKSLKDGN